MRYRGVTVDQDRLVVELRLWGMAMVLCGLFFGIDRLGALGWFRGGIERGVLTIDAQVFKIQRWVMQPFTWIRYTQQSAERVANLEERLTQAAVDQTRLKTLEAQVTALEALTLRVQSGQRADRLAQLIQYGDRVMVASGARDGLLVGQVITDQEGVLLGRVGKVGRYMSVVEILSEREMRVPVQTTSGSSKGILTGKGEGKTELTDVLQSEPLVAGDVLVTAGVEAGFPPGLVVGQVMEMTGKPEEVTKGGTVALLGRLEGWVAIW